MKGNPQSKLALILASASIVLVAVMAILSHALRRAEWFAPDMVGLPALGCAIAGGTLGWMNLRFAAGKVAAAIGTAMLLYVFLVYFSKS